MEEVCGTEGAAGVMIALLCGLVVILGVGVPMVVAVAGLVRGLTLVYVSRMASLYSG